MNLLALATLVILALAAIAAINRSPAPAPSSVATATVQPVPASKSVDELLAMSADQLATIDIAEMNLACAEGLPGAESLNVRQSLETLDTWARLVQSETERHWYQFRKNPGEYRNSAGYFRMLMLITILQQDLGVHYNPERIRDVNFGKSKDLFIHGMIGDDNGGTCVSMPVLYTAVARRLGYPVKLVLTKAHVFCRWDGPNDRFNIEATNRGLNTHPDSYYRQWPHSVNDAELKTNRYLVSLTPTEELASFMATRGHCLLDTGRPKEAAVAYAAATRLAPHDAAYRAWAAQGSGRGMKAQDYIFRMPVANSRPQFDVQKFNAAAQPDAQNHQQMWPPGDPSHDITIRSPLQNQRNFNRESQSGRFSPGQHHNPWRTPMAGSQTDHDRNAAFSNPNKPWQRIEP